MLRAHDAVAKGNGGVLAAREGRKPRFALGQSRYDRPMWSLLYLVARTPVRLLVGGGQQGQDDGAKDLEILVLRHQLRVSAADVGPTEAPWHRFGSSSQRRVGSS